MYRAMVPTITGEGEGRFAVASKEQRKYKRLAKEGHDTLTRETARKQLRKAFNEMAEALDDEFDKEDWDELYRDNDEA